MMMIINRKPPPPAVAYIHISVFSAAAIPTVPFVVTVTVDVPFPDGAVSCVVKATGVVGTGT